MEPQASGVHGSDRPLHKLSPFLSEAAILGAVSALIYLVTYKYEAGFCGAFNIPVEFITLTSAMLVANALASLLAFATLMYMLAPLAVQFSAQYDRFIRPWNVLIATTLLLAILVVRADFYWWVFLCILLAVFNAPWSTDWHSRGTAANAVLSAVLLVNIAPLVGHYVGASKTEFLVPVNQDDWIVLRRYDDTLVLARFDSAEKAILPDFRFIEYKSQVADKQTFRLQKIENYTVTKP